MSAVIDENTQFQDTNGVPIVNGFIYIGSKSLDPVLNPITIYSDRALTTVLSNPQRTDDSGRAVNKIWIPEQYSLKIEDVNNVQKLIDLDAGQVPSTGTTKLTNVQGINAITAEGVPAITQYIDKQIYIFTIASNNTGAVTLDIDSVGAKSIDNTSAAGTFSAGNVAVVVFNSGTDSFQIVLAIPNTVPSGGIIAWSGAISAIPAGWVICDGTNGTPNLTGRFIIHASADSGDTYDVDDTGGSTTTGPATLSTAQLAAHTHTNKSETGASTQFYENTGANALNPFSASGGSAGSSDPHSHSNSLPPYYALAYIMKT